MSHILTSNDRKMLLDYFGFSSTTPEYELWLKALDTYVFNPSFVGLFAYNVSDYKTDDDASYYQAQHKISALLKDGYKIETEFDQICLYMKTGEYI